MRILSRIWFPIIGALCLVMGTFLWALQSWAAPYMPLVVAVLGAAAIVLVALKMRRDFMREMAARVVVEFAQPFINVPDSEKPTVGLVAPEGYFAKPEDAEEDDSEKPTVGLVAPAQDFAKSEDVEDDDSEKPTVGLVAPAGDIAKTEDAEGAETSDAPPEDDASEDDSGAAAATIAMAAPPEDDASEDNAAGEEAEASSSDTPEESEGEPADALELSTGEAAQRADDPDASDAEEATATEEDSAESEDADASKTQAPKAMALVIPADFAQKLSKMRGVPAADANVPRVARLSEDADLPADTAPSEEAPDAAAEAAAVTPEQDERRDAPESRQMTLALKISDDLFSRRAAASQGTPETADDGGAEDAAPVVELREFLAPHLVASILAIAACGLWLLSPVRQSAVAMASEFNVLSADAMRTDPDPAVRTTVCRAMLRDTAAGEYGELVEIMDASAALRRDCLRPEVDAENPTAVGIMQRLARRWRGELDALVARGEDAQACPVAGRLGALARDEDRLALLKYSARTSSAKAHRCMSEAVGDISDLAALLGAPQSLDASLADGLLEPLTRRVFFETSDQPTDWSSAPNQRWVWGLACSMAGSPHADLRRAAAESLEPMTQQLACVGEDDAVARRGAPLNWTQLCQALKKPLAASAEPDSLCPVVIKQRVETAVAFAQGIVVSAATRVVVSAAADDIVRTPVGAGSPPSADELARERVMNMTPADYYDDSTLTPSVNCERVVEHLFGADSRAAAQALEQLDGNEDPDCGPNPKMLTFGERRARLHQLLAAQRLNLDDFEGRELLNKGYGEARVNAVLERVKKDMKR